MKRCETCRLPVPTEPGQTINCATCGREWRAEWATHEFKPVYGRKSDLQWFATDGLGGKAGIAGELG